VQQRGFGGGQELNKIEREHDHGQPDSDALNDDGQVENDAQEEGENDALEEEANDERNEMKKNDGQEEEDQNPS